MKKSGIMHLNYEFSKNGKVYNGFNVDIGESCDLEAEAQKIESLKIDAVCHALDLTIDEFEEKNINIDDYDFNHCELQFD